MQVKQKMSKRGDVLLAVGLLVAIAAVWHNQVTSRERAAELAAFCVEQPTEPFREKLACMTKPKQRIQP